MGNYDISESALLTAFATARDSALLESEILRARQDRLINGCRLCGTKSHAKLASSLCVEGALYDSEVGVTHYGDVFLCEGCVEHLVEKLGEKRLDRGARKATLRRLSQEAHSKAQEFYLPRLETANRAATQYEEQWRAEKKRAEKAEKKLENFYVSKRKRDADRKEARRVHDQRETERKRTQDPMIRRTLMSDEQRRIDQKVTKLFLKAQGTSEHEALALLLKARELVVAHEITIVKKEVLEWLHQPIMSAETPNMRLDRPYPLSLASSRGE